jgi:dTDP-4-dehydrorhamnose reductase
MRARSVGMGLLNKFLKIEKIGCKVNPVISQQYPTPAKRPRNSLMNKDKISHELDVSIKYWKESLRIFIAALDKNLIVSDKGEDF